MTTAINTKPAIGLLRLSRRDEEHDRIAIGTLIRTPTGAEATVVGYRGFRRGHRVWLVCKYVAPANKRFDIVQLLPELVVLVERKEAA